MGDYVCRKKSFGIFGGTVPFTSLKCRFKDKKFHETQCISNEDQSCSEDKFCSEKKCKPRLEYMELCKDAKIGLNEEQGCKSGLLCSQTRNWVFGGKIPFSQFKCRTKQ